MKKCGKCGQVKNDNEFYTQKSKGARGKLSTYCKECNGKKSSEYYKKNKEKCRVSHKEWVERNKEKVAFTKAESAYGITREQYDSMPNVCQICGSTKSLVIDHSHKSGRIRGRLCNSCNKGLGFFDDNPALLERASDYVLGQAKELKREMTYEQP